MTFTPNAYATFLHAKLWSHAFTGLPTRPDDLPDTLFAFQRDLVAFALTKGRAAIFADTGLGKTRMELTVAQEIVTRTNGNVLILAPLAVAPQTVREGQAIGVTVRYCRSQADVQPGITITNYEMLSHFDLTSFVGVILDESSILKAFDGKFSTLLIESFNRTPYRFAFTATPAPNDHTEIGRHAEFLGVMTRSEMLSTFFINDTGDTGVWRLKGHAVAAFWSWVSTWAAAVRKPSDLGYEDGAYNLPPLNIIHERLESEATQGALFALAAASLTEQRAAKKESLVERCERAAALVAREPSEQWLVWCELNEEGDLLQQLIPGAVQVAGADTREHKEAAMLGFADGKVRVLITKPKVAGFGMNWQSCARVIFVNVTHSYEQFYQAVRRCYRFGQTRNVNVHCIYSEAEGAIIDNLQRKERDAAVMASQMVAFMRFENDGAASRRDSDSYTPTQPLRVPAWLKETA